MRRPGAYLEGVQDLHQAGELGGAPPLQVVVLLPGVPAGGLPVRQDAVLEPGQAPGAVGVRQVLPSCGQDPARAGVSMTPWAPSRGGRIQGPAPEEVKTSSSLGTELGQAQRVSAVVSNQSHPAHQNMPLPDTAYGLHRQLSPHCDPGHHRVCVQTLPAT